MSSKARDRVSQAPESSAAPTVSPEPPRDAPAPPLCRRPLTNSPAFRLETSIKKSLYNKLYIYISIIAIKFNALMYAINCFSLTLYKYLTQLMC